MPEPELLIDNFDFDVPEALIAKTPLKQRDHARLLYCDRDNTLRNQHFYDLPELIPSDAILVFNNSKVIKSRLLGQCHGRAVEIFLLEETAQSDTWICLAKPGKKLKIGDRVYFSEVFYGEIIEKIAEKLTVYLCSQTLLVEDAIEREGYVPIPPYIQSGHETTDSFREEYQSIFATKKGAVAAPTASLHFTQDLIKRLHGRGIQTLEVTLHVGWGTFQPIQVKDISQHRMHAEHYEISNEVASHLNQALTEKRPIIAVGSTVARTLETAYRNGKICAGMGKSSLFIYPGYTCSVIRGIITNFHLPKSSLFVLVSALRSSEFMKKTYTYAIEQNYRFYSFGDGMYLPL